MDIYQMDNKIINNLNLKETTSGYILEKEGNVIGYGIISYDSNNIIEIVIKEEYRSNGYGKYLFGKLLEVLKKQDYKDIKLTIKKENYRIKNIITYYGGQQLCTFPNEESYIIPINKMK